MNTLRKQLARLNFTFKSSDSSCWMTQLKDLVMHMELQNILLHISNVRNEIDYEPWIPPFLILIENHHHAILDHD